MGLHDRYGHRLHLRRFRRHEGITYTQIAQYCVLIFAYTVPAVFISLHLTGNPIPQLGLGDTLTDGSGIYLLDKLDQDLHRSWFRRLHDAEGLNPRTSSC